MSRYEEQLFDSIAEVYVLEYRCEGCEYNNNAEDACHHPCGQQLCLHVLMRESLEKELAEYEEDDWYDYDYEEEEEMSE